MKVFGDQFRPCMVLQRSSLVSRDRMCGATSVHLLYGHTEAILVVCFGLREVSRLVG